MTEGLASELLLDIRKFSQQDKEPRPHAAEAMTRLSQTTTLETRNE